jgi:hypothetical protein
MASTSLKNLPRQYCTDQRREHINREYLVYKGKKIPNKTMLPGFGINMGNMAGAYTHSILSQNTPDLESYLFGIGTSNLVKPFKKPSTRTNNLDTVKFFEQTNAEIPVPLVIEKSQRPIGPFS